MLKGALKNMKFHAKTSPKQNRKKPIGIKILFSFFPLYENLGFK